MKYSMLFRYMALVLTTTAFLALMGCGCGGCAAQTHKETDGAARAIQWDLSPEAQATYHFLLYDQALRQEDEVALVQALTGLAPSHPPATMYVESGIWLMGRKSLLAADALQTGLRLFPDDASLNLLYAETLMESGNADAAVGHMEKFVRKHPGNADARLELALLLVKSNRFAQAEKLLAAVGGKQRTTLVEYYHARALLGLHRQDEAIPHLRRAVKLTPDFVEGMAELAYIHERRKKYAQARAMYEKILRLNDSGQDVLLRLIALSLRLNQPEKALGFLKKGPATPAFRLTAASMFMEAKQFAHAEKLLKALSREPNAPSEIYFYLAGIAYDGHKDIPEALHWLTKIPADSRYYDRSLLLRVQMLVDDGKMEEALEAARAAQKLTPGQRELWQMEVRLLAALRRNREALEAADNAMHLWPEDVEMAFLHASLLDESGDKKAAMTAMEALIQRHPDHYQALNYVGYTLAEENRDLDRALLLLQKALSLSPESAYIADSLAWAQFRSGRLEEAWDSIRRAVSLKGDADPTIWEHYGDIARALGKTEEARKGYTKALELQPANAASIQHRLSKL